VSRRSSAARIGVQTIRETWPSLAKVVSLDAVIVGAGPNGLTAAVTLASRGHAVRVYEAAATVGGGARTEELTLPGFRHDPCSAVHAYWLLVGPFRGRRDELAADVLRPRLTGLPAHPVRLARFGLRSALPTAALAGALLRGPRARALLAGLAGHAMVPLTSVATSGIALLLAIAAHEVGWPFAAGGSQAISDALAGHLTELGGEIVTGSPVRSWRDLPNARAFIFDTSPAMLAEIAAGQLPPGHVSQLSGYRYGPACSRSTTPWPARCRGRHRPRAGPARCTWGPGTATSRRRCGRPATDRRPARRS
jgi:phytoene dehydrogenase-like protein